MKTKIFFYFLLINFSLTTKIFAQYSVIMDNIRTVQWDNVNDWSALENSVVTNLLDMQADGSWSSINYTSKAQTSWQPADHLKRIKDMALAVSKSSSSYYQNQSLYTKIETGMQFWYDKNPTSSNWYNQQIRCPKLVGEILILMRETPYPISQALETNLLNRMVSIGGNPSNSYATSGMSNKINISTHFIYRGCLKEDLTVLETGINGALSPVQINGPGKGVQGDYSYQEHDKQLYINNYGYQFVDNISNIALYVKDTPYALAGDKLAVLSNYIRGIYINTIRGQYMSFSAPGRQIALEGKLNVSNTVAILQRMKQIDPTNITDYENAIARWSGTQPANYNLQASHNHYWFSDFTTHVRPNYSIDVRFVSSRTRRTENVNNENLKGHFLADGATNIVANGNEYFNVFPSWNWCHIPGVTAPNITSLSNVVKDKVVMGNTTFAGGVSDGLYGASIYNLNFPAYKVTGKKSWFFFDDEIVCLGADINSIDTENPIHTTVNQTLLSGDITYSNGVSTNSLTLGQPAVVSNAQWVLHNGFGYVFPNGNNVNIQAKTQTGNWYDIAVSQTNTTVSNDVFSLWMDHGVAPSMAKYEYIIVPNKTSSTEMDSYIAANNIEIARNSDTLQVVHHKQLDIWQMVFHKANTIFDNGSVKAWTDASCLLMLKPGAGNTVIAHIADPNQSAINITVYLQWPGISGIKMVTVAMPTGTDKGATQTFTIDGSSPLYTSDLPTFDIVLAVTEDTHVDQASGKTGLNYGAATGLIVKKNSSTSQNNREAYFKFKLNDLTLDATYIQKVKLRVVVKSLNATPPSAGTYNWIVKHVATDTWSAGTGGDTGVGSTGIGNGLTWANTHTSTTGITPVAAMAVSSTVLASARGAQPAETAIDFDITSQFLTEYAGDKIISLMLFSDVGHDKGDAQFYSSEAPEGKGPRLIIETSEPAVLPLNLNYFKARKSDYTTLISWQTAQEVNTKLAEIYRSTNGTAFEKIGDIALSGNSQMATEYHFTDFHPYGNTNYYKLKLIDNNSNYKWSDVQTVNFKLTNTEDVRIYPNPAATYVYIQSTNSAHMQLINSLGKVLTGFDVKANEQKNIAVANLPSGVYFIKNLETGSVKKLVIRN